ncbi:hypothetical protein LOTGIDRAFT_232185 [Lottia gigantea]|uniref:Ribosome-binding factor A, mitochondrial n=1 Tax=Lottia gigantea TaxID=225164 RepID=V4ADY6_LOTGI|nr:hypothetical protein LOTGIDRAFT_232185 [Lottia gigantea]ESO95077.1 hypothetical protein LOTGIDRAFT_232185 [Lottia gigantea]
MLKNTITSNISLFALGVQRITLRWKNDEVRMARILQKMYLKQNNTKKRFKPQFDFVPRHESVTGDSKTESRKRVESNGQQRRARQVGKVLYDYLVQIINTGELDPYLSANNVEITGVKVEPDFTSMNVYWSATGTQKDEEIEMILRKNQGKLRHVLTSYHLISFVPCINFVKDKSVSNVRRVEEILKSIDFGPNFTPTTVPLDIVQHQYSIEPPQSIKDKIEHAKMAFHEKDLLSGIYDTQQNLVSESDNKPTDENVARSKNDIYGVQQDEIMTNLIIKKSKERTRSVIKNPDFSNQISPNLSTCASKQYNQLALKLKKPKVEKAKKILRQMEHDYIFEKFKMVKEKDEEYELEIEQIEEEEDEELFNEKWKMVQDKEDDKVDIDEYETYNNDK